MDGSVRGKILKGVGGLYEVMCEDGSIISCCLRGAFRYEKIKPYIGDDVVVCGEDGNAVIDEILPPKNRLIRPPVSNLDVLFAVASASSPAPDTVMIDKLISIAEYNDIEPVIIISKSDMDEDAAARLVGIYRKSGFGAFALSSASLEGTEEFRRFAFSAMRGKTSAFAGASGVGKSTLMNVLFPSLDLQTGEVSRKIARGRHTTRHVQLYPIEKISGDFDGKGFIADTPGFGLLDFVHFDFYTKDDLPGLFRDFRPYIGCCRYTKCTHTKEEGCAIIEAVKKGDIAAERHESFLRIYEDIKDKREWDKNNRKAPR